MSNLKNHLFNLGDENMRDYSFTINRRKILFEKRIDNNSLKKYLNLFKHEKAYNHN
jgi:hypothetical protein